MADDTDCLLNILKPENLKAFFGDKPPPEAAIKAMANDLRQLKMSSEADPSLGSYNSRLNAYIRDVEFQKQVENGFRASEIRKARDVKNYLNQKSNYEKPFQAFKAKLSGNTTLLSVGGRDSTFGRVNGLHNEITSKIFHGLADMKLEDIANSGHLDSEARQVARALSLGDEMPKVSEEGKQYGLLMHQVNKMMLAAARNADIPVRNLPGFTGTILDDFQKLHASTFEEWAQVAREAGIDKEKTFGVAAGNREAEDKILKSIYESKKLGFGSPESAIPKIDEEVREGVSYSRKLSEKRMLRFTDAVSEQKYLDKFGKGNYLQTTLADVARKSRMIGLVSHWGENPEAGLNNAIETQLEKYKADNRMDLYNDLQKGRKELQDIMHVATNKSSIPGLNTLASVTDGILTSHVMSKLWFSGVMSLPNLAVTAATLRSYTGSGFMENMARIGKDWLKGFPAEARAAAAREAGFAISDANTSSIQSGNTMFSSVTKGFSYLAKNMTKFNGMDFVNSMQFHFARHFMSDVAEASLKSWDTIHPQMKTGLLMAGITEKEFPLLQHAIEQMPDGRKMVTVEGLGNLDKALVKEQAAAKGLSLSAYIQDLKSRYMGTIIHGMTDSTTSSTWRERAIISRGYEKGTWPRAIFELVGQFKQFLFQSGNIAAKIANQTADPVALAKGELTNSAHYSHGEMAKFLMGATAMAGISLVLKEESKRAGNAVFDEGNKAFHNAMGWAPPQPVVSPGNHNIDPRSSDFWVQAINRGGVGSMFMDAILGDNDVFPFGEALLGPTIGPLADQGLKEIALGRKSLQRDMTKAEKNDAASTAGRLLKSIVPFGQLPLMEQALNYGYYNVLKEYMSPGYVHRRALRQQRESVEKINK